MYKMCIYFDNLDINNNNNNINFIYLLYIIFLCIGPQLGSFSRTTSFAHQLRHLATPNPKLC